MKKSTISNLFDVLSRKIISCFVTKNTVSRLDFFKFEDRIIVNPQTEIGKIKNVLLHFSIIFIMCMTGIFSWSQNLATRETSNLKTAVAFTDAFTHNNKVYLPWETQYWQQNAIKLDYQNYTTQDGIIYKENGYSLTPSLLPLVGAATPCEAHRWLAGDGWRKGNSPTSLWEAVVQNAPNLQPKGIVRCASSAETESGLQVFKGSYDAASNPIAAILPKTDCYSMTSGTFGNELLPPTQGEDIVWFNFDIRPLAGTYQFQIVTNESVGFVLFHVDPTNAQPINGETTGTKYPVPNNGLSGNCANLTFANIDVTGVAHPACGFSGNGWTTITVPSFKKPTNYYLAMWMAKPTETAFPGSMNLVYKSRYGCGGATCTLEFDKKNTICNTDGTYTVCMDYGGSAGRWNLVDNGAIKASLYTIKTFKEDGVTQVGSTQTSTNLASSPLSLTLGTIPDGAVLATIC
ncbi:hypothetical protein, partial [Flavobacterium sp.]|uniref:hypothetical protein n=1 Tax=Flavobacterium sp. TaxID=239 RepID=UPI002B4B887C